MGPVDAAMDAAAMYKTQVEAAGHVFHDLPLRGPHAHQRGAQIHPPLAPTAARRYSSGRQPMHLIDERPPEPRSNRGMDLIAVQAPLHP